MATEALEKPLETALDRIEQALSRLEAAGLAKLTKPDSEELAALRTRHRKLKDTVTQEIQQLDLLLANLPR